MGKTDSLTIQLTIQVKLNQQNKEDTSIFLFRLLGNIIK